MFVLVLKLHLLIVLKFMLQPFFYIFTLGQTVSAFNNLV